ncbi:MAG: hypothetical protein KC910_23235 [Candidatus Eremiobacteraeota bacterium]|nr:hypothetical protein [Candidatus Eremiobacteraeota bacterium]
MSILKPVTGRVDIPRSTLPSLPEVPQDGRATLTETFTFSGPASTEERLGSIPRDFTRGLRSKKPIEHDGYGNYSVADRGSRNITASNPIGDAQGNPQMETRQVSLTAKPYSKVISMLSRGMEMCIVASAAGGLAGALVGYFAPSALGELAAAGAFVTTLYGGLGGFSLGGVAGALAGGFSGYSEAANDRVSFQWQERPIVEQRLTGVNYRVVSDDDDYRHKFSPVIEKTDHGTYFVPVVVHSADQ